VQDRGLNGDGELPYLREEEHIMLARILVAQERLTEARELLERLLKAAEAGGRIARVIEIRMIQALACRAQGNDEEVLTALESALLLAEPGGYVRTFIDEGEPMAKLLRQAACRGIAVDHMGKILDAFLAGEPFDYAQDRQKSGGAEEFSFASASLPPGSSAHTEPPHSPALIEPLSERELEVLGLIAEGLTNQEIATRLFLTLNTVKAHAHNIYGKLTVNNRTHAVARARELGLLPPF
jgi:LuxR family maltose regulon positive regulatory protein